MPRSQPGARAFSIGLRRIAAPHCERAREFVSHRAAILSGARDDRY
jgi:hypothetical protein